MTEADIHPPSETPAPAKPRTWGKWLRGSLFALLVLMVVFYLGFWVVPEMARQQKISDANEALAAAYETVSTKRPELADWSKATATYLAHIDPKTQRRFAAQLFKFDYRLAEFTACMSALEGGTDDEGKDPWATNGYVQRLRDDGDTSAPLTDVDAAAFLELTSPLAELYREYAPTGFPDPWLAQNDYGEWLPIQSLQANLIPFIDLMRPAVTLARLNAHARFGSSDAATQELRDFLAATDLTSIVTSFSEYIASAGRRLQVEKVRELRHTLEVSDEVCQRFENLTLTAPPQEKLTAFSLACALECSRRLLHDPESFSRDFRPALFKFKDFDPESDHNESQTIENPFARSGWEAWYIGPEWVTQRGYGEKERAWAELSFPYGAPAFLEAALAKLDASLESPGNLYGGLALHSGLEWADDVVEVYQYFAVPVNVSVGFRTSFAANLVEQAEFNKQRFWLRLSRERDTCDSLEDFQAKASDIAGQYAGTHVHACEEGVLVGISIDMLVLKDVQHIGATELLCGDFSPAEFKTRAFKYSGLSETNADNWQDRPETELVIWRGAAE